MKLAFAGAGYINKIHARAASAQNRVELVVAVDRFSTTAAGFAQVYRIESCFATEEQILNAIMPDALMVGMPKYLHASQTIAALKTGVHAMVEKPMAMNTSEAHKMMEAGQRYGSQLDTQMEYFIQCIRDHRTSSPGALEGWTNMKIIAVAYESASIGSVTQVD